MSDELPPLKRKRRINPDKPPGWPKGKSRAKKDKHGWTAPQVSKLLELRARGLSEEDVARTLGRPRSSVHLAIANYAEWLERAQETAANYAPVRETLLSAAECEFLQLMSSPSRQAAASLHDCARAFRVVHNANRLERNLSTANTNVQSFTKRRELPKIDR